MSHTFSLGNNSVQKIVCGVVKMLLLKPVLGGVFRKNVKLIKRQKESEAYVTLYVVIPASPTCLLLVDEINYFILYSGVFSKQLDSSLKCRCFFFADFLCLCCRWPSGLEILLTKVSMTFILTLKPFLCWSGIHPATLISEGSTCRCIRFSLTQQQRRNHSFLYAVNRSRAR